MKRPKEKLRVRRARSRASDKRGRTTRRRTSRAVRRPARTSRKAYAARIRRLLEGNLRHTRGVKVRRITLQKRTSRGSGGSKKTAARGTVSVDFGRDPRDFGTPAAARSSAPSDGATSPAAAPCNTLCIRMSKAERAELNAWAERRFKRREKAEGYTWGLYQERTTSAAARVELLALARKGSVASKARAS